MKAELTALGKNLLLRALTGETISFTKMSFGNGQSQDAETAKDLFNPLLSVDIADISQEENYVTLTALFTNNDLEAGFRVTEIGVFALDPNDNTKEILYAIGNDTEDVAEYIPDKSQKVYGLEMSLMVFVGEAENITTTINESSVYASAADLQKHVEDVGNPHKVDAVAVGLGNVPNVSTNDQTPTYEIALDLSELQSGEKLKTAFGKLKLGLKSLINHLADKANPHGTSAEQIGAAEKSHYHSAADINSGTLGIARGGTGGSTAAAARESLGVAPVGLITEYITITDLSELDDKLTAIYTAMENKSVKFIHVSISGAYYCLRLWKATADYGSVDLLSYFYGSGYRRRYLYNGEWTDWEYENPPMEVGVEYRTTERWLGKAVYVKVFVVENLAVSGKYTAFRHGLSATQIVRANGQINFTDGIGGGDCLPFHRSSLGTIHLDVSLNTIALNTVEWTGDNDISQLSATVQVWYIKD